MRKKYSESCDLCETGKIERIETNPDDRNDQLGICYQCLLDNGYQCEVCGDAFVNFGWHVRDNVKNEGLRP